MLMAETRWLTMMSTWHVRFRLAVQFPKKSSHLGSAGSKAEGLGSVTGVQAAMLAWQGGARQHSAGCLDRGEVAYQVKGSLSAQS